MPRVRRKYSSRWPEEIETEVLGRLGRQSAERIQKELERMVGKGDLSAFTVDDVPSANTIREWQKRVVRDQSHDWTLESKETAAADAPKVLEVLAAVVDRSGGAIRHLTEREARLAVVYHSIERDPWRAYILARAYLAKAGNPEWQREATIFDAEQYMKRTERENVLNDLWFEQTSKELDGEAQGQ